MKREYWDTILILCAPTVGQDLVLIDDKIIQNDSKKCGYQSVEWIRVI